jgi:hypothetical protein
MIMSWPEVRSRRMVRHGLSFDGCDGLVAAARAMCGAHAQIMSAAELSLGIRYPGSSRADVRAALWTDQTLVKTYGPRGTVHLLPAEDLASWLAALSAVPDQGATPDTMAMSEDQTAQPSPRATLPRQGSTASAQPERPGRQLPDPADRRRGGRRLAREALRIHDRDHHGAAPAAHREAAGLAGGGGGSDWHDQRGQAKPDDRNGLGGWARVMSLNVFARAIALLSRCLSSSAREGVVRPQCVARAPNESVAVTRTR